MDWKYYRPKFEYEETFPDFGWPWFGHKFFVYDFVRNFKPKTIVELGTHKGTSFWSFCQAVKDENFPAELFAVDTWKGEEHAGFYGEEVFEEVKRIQKKYYKDLKINLLRKTFDKAMADFKEKSIDLLHIDGLHTYEAVKHDFENWISKVKDDGVIIFHDIFVNQNDFGVYKLWEELKKKYKTIEFYHSFGLGVLFKNAEKYKELIDREKELQMTYSFSSEDKKNWEINKDLEMIQQKDQEIQQKDFEIEQRDQIIQQKDFEIEQRDQIIQQKEQIIQEKEAEIAIMKSSKFWKMREIFLKIKLFKKQIYHKPSKNILFISHDASRSGAPFVLLYFLRWLKKNTNVKFSVLLQNGGELEEEFKEVAPTYVWNMSLLNSGYPRIIYYILKYTGLRKMASKNRLLRLIKKENFDLIFANSIASSESIIGIKNMANIPVINFVHELENAIVDCCGIDTLKKASKFVDYYIGSSEPVIENLKRNHDISKDKIELVHDYIPASEFFKNKDSYNSANLREELGIPQSAFVVGASGTIEWRKGIDLYPQIASIAREKSSVPVYFIWIGGDKNSAEYERVAQDLKKMKLKNRVFFVEYKIDYFSMIDAFILPSREDPYPLVCLQAAAFQKLIICFDSAGGMPEFVGKDCGFVVPYMDIEKAAEKIIYLAENRDIASEMGKNASKKVLEQHDVEKVSKKLLEIINKISL